MDTHAIGQSQLFILIPVSGFLTILTRIFLAKSPSSTVSFVSGRTYGEAIQLPSSLVVPGQLPLGYRRARPIPRAIQEEQYGVVRHHWIKRVIPNGNPPTAELPNSTSSTSSKPLYPNELAGKRTISSSLMLPTLTKYDSMIASSQRA